MKKGCWIHLLIIVGFIIYLLNADYLIGIIRVEDESKAQTFEVKPNNSNIDCSIDFIRDYQIDWKQLIHIEGWAVIKNLDPRDNKVFVVLKSDHETYIYDTINLLRQDLENLGKYEHWKYAGFKAMIPISILNNGLFQVGIYIQNRSTKSLIYTGTYISKYKNQVVREDR